MAALRKVVARHNILSLFSGAGALDLAFERTGLFSTSIFVEYEPEFARTLRTNQLRGMLSSGLVIEDDVRTLDPQEVISRAPSPMSGIIGGPPCEAFSSMGRRQGAADPRGLLVRDFARWVSILRPGFFVMENVPQLATLDNGELLANIEAGLRGDGYSITVQVLNAADFGAPTSRRRLFMVGTLPPWTFDPPVPTHHDPQLPRSQGGAAWRTVRDALTGLPAPQPNAPAAVSHHRIVQHTPEVRDRFQALRPGSYDNIRKRSRLALDRPSPSLIAGNLKGTRSHIHPIEPRELTNRECARLQGFPDDFEFEGRPAAVAKQIANAVPVELGIAVARSLSQTKDNTAADI